MKSETLEAINDLMSDVKRLATCDQAHERFIHQRIQLAAEALVGRERAVDTGPWTVSADGRYLESDNFKHDVRLKVDGDFYGDGDRIAYATAIANALNKLNNQ